MSVSATSSGTTNDLQIVKLSTNSVSSVSSNSVPSTSTSSTSSAHETTQPKDIYLYKDHMNEWPRCYSEDRCCYPFSLRGRAEIYDNQREAYRDGEYLQCMKFALASRFTWCAQTTQELFINTCCGVSTCVGGAACVGCGTWFGVAGCLKATILCCDKNSKNTLGMSFFCCAFGGACCAFAFLNWLLIPQNLLLCPIMSVAPEVPLACNLLGALHWEEKRRDELLALMGVGQKKSVSSINFTPPGVQSMHTI